MKHLTLILGICTLLISSLFVHAQDKSLSSDPIWTSIDESSITTDGVRYIIPEKYLTFRLDLNEMQSQLDRAPLEFSDEALTKAFIISLPMADGSFSQFKLVESPIMAPELAERYPAIKTYAGQGIDDPSATTRLDLAPQGFHAIIFSTKGTVYIDPYSKGDIENYLCYFKKDFHKDANFSCEEYHLPETEDFKENKSSDNISKDDDNNDSNLVYRTTGQLRTYDLALACTGEYANFHGGTTAGALAAFNTSMNRVNGIYEREIAARMILIANTDDLIFLNSGSDPYTNNDGGAMLGQNQTTCDNIIGFNNYDIGHVFSTGGGGVAYLQSVCSGSKAGGVTGSGSPVGDPFDVDYVAHEIGHQFGGSHTFNGNTGSCGGNGSSSNAYEPGSGTTIQAYAGICGNASNIQNNSDDYFHLRSLQQMISFSTNGGGDNCPSYINNGNSQPSSNAGADYVIPISTPFTLTGTGSDANGDAITYCWEQYDLGPFGTPNSPSGDAPIFRSFEPVTSPSRTFPQWSDIVNNTQTLGEILPTYARTMHFRLVVRDNRSDGGCVAEDETEIDVVSSAGPFLVQVPNTGLTWTGFDTENVTWDVANTTASPISCANVDILLSTDGGYTYPTTLATNVPNDGSHPITVPNINTNTARVMVVCSDNVFFDISNQNFTIEETTGPTFSLSASPNSAGLCPGQSTNFSVDLTSINGFNSSVSLSATGNPSNTSISFSPTSVTPTGSSTMTVSASAAAPVGTYTITINANGGGVSNSTTVQLIINSGPPGNITLNNPANGSVGLSNYTLDWSAASGANNYEVEISTDPGFTNIVESATVATNSYTATSLNISTQYFWRVRATNGCGTSPDSATFNFETANIVCNTYISTDIPVNISGNAGGSVISETSEITIGDSGTIIDINVIDLSGTHTWINDLTFDLEGPSGTNVSLLPQICNNQNNFDISFDDESSATDPPCPPTDGNSYQPNGNLSDFDGEELNGNWTLTMSDLYPSEDGGQLQNWALEICYTPQVVNLDLKVILEGPYLGGGNMSNELQTLGLLPSTQPFSAGPWNYPGTESNLSSATNIVDWILVEARSAANNASIIEQRAGLLLTDGSIIEADGSGAGLRFFNLGTSSTYFFSVKTRNHMAVMTDEDISVNGLINFSQTANVSNGNTQLVNLGGGVFGLHAGDFTSNNVFTVDDFNAYIADPSNIYSYSNLDTNKDGLVTIEDYNLYRKNMSKSAVPVLQY